MAFETPAGTVDGVNTTFTASGDLGADHILVVDRAVQVLNTDYTYSGRTITFLAGAIPQVGALVRLALGANGLPAGTGGSPGWDTAANLISDAALELGLVTSAIANPWASTNQHVVLLRTLLKSKGRELAKLRRWTHLVKEYTFATVDGTAAYDLPSDFRELVDQSGWNRTTQWPLGGPLSPQQWQYLKAHSSSPTLTVMFRPSNGQMVLYPTPTAVETVAFEYASRFWVQPDGQSSPTSETPSAASDTICFDPNLVVRALKLAFKEAKGFDTSAALADFQQALEAAFNDDSFAPVLSLSGPSGDFPFLSHRNTPDSGFGT